jgi:hypothetical protein
MWDDRLLFVIAALSALAYSVLRRRNAELERNLHFGRTEIKVRTVLVVAAIVVFVVIVGSRVLLYWDSSRSPNVGSVIAILLGALVGMFTAKFVSSLFGSEFGKRDPIFGAGILALLIVVYSLPLYADAITDIFTGIGLAAVKTPFLELNLRERGTKSYTGAAGNQANAGGIPRSNNPLPGLKWLRYDTSIDTAEKKDANNTFSADEAYIDRFEERVFRGEDYNSTAGEIRDFLASAHILSNCLNSYVDDIPDSALLVVDIKPAIESLFEAHAKAKRSKTGGEAISFPFWKGIKQVLGNVNPRFSVKACDFGGIENKGELDDNSTIRGFQPYSALVLADLIYAHGAQDEAIGILAEWLSHSRKAEKAREREGKAIPKWWELRVESRIALWMVDVAGQNNAAYRAFINHYKKDLEEYFGKVEDTFEKPRRVSLDQLQAKCKSWQSGSKKSSLVQDKAITEQKAYYLLLAAEDESLRTELNFIAEEGGFGHLEDLYRRASFLAEIKPECLPWSFPFDGREAIIADHWVTVGLVGLTVGDRMQTLALSRGDRDRASDIARDGERFLRKGYAFLNERVNKERSAIQAGGREWIDRMFDQSEWEKSVNLAELALIRLRTKD